MSTSLQELQAAKERFEESFLDWEFDLDLADRFGDVVDYNDIEFLDWEVLDIEFIEEIDDESSLYRVEVELDTKIDLDKPNLSGTVEGTLVKIFDRVAI